MNILALAIEEDAMGKRIIRGTALVLLGSYAGGVLFTAVAPSLFALPQAAFLRWWQALNRDYQVLPPFLIATVGLLVAHAVLSRRQGARASTAAWLAAALLVASIGVTVALLAPMNEVADTLTDDTIPADFAATVQRWQQLHLVRTVLALGAFLALVVSVDRPDAPVPGGVGPRAAVAAR